MKINDSILRQIEQLAKLSVSEQDRDLSIKKIVDVLEMLDQIDTDDLADLQPLYHPLEIHQPMREDIPDGNILRDKIQQQAPQVDNGLFLVPKVIE
ncbi:MAG: Asp-tRNA(Asn)/Glu-tRNA(Gln) amidotransferase GatCAB subunit C [Gammaproteobacteria bacterium]|nr:MAG: Asp-tRNA(Asn)/Glu-tRNA(Gln) amidotransferase GatCAB subunit C [Gammaproteobacteria bacterium]